MYSVLSLGRAGTANGEVNERIQRERTGGSQASPCVGSTELQFSPYKDPGGPAQLGTRDWAGLKGHIDDRNLACSLASEGRSEAPRPGGRLGAAQTGTVLSFLLVMCNFRPFGLNASRCISLVRVCSGHWKFVALWHFELPHASHIAQIRSIVSRQFVLLCPVGSIAPLHFMRAFVLTAFEAPSVSER